MLGRDHALLGALAFLAGAPIVAASLKLPMPPAELAVGTCVCAGFALLPDIDEPHSTVSRKLGPISMGVSAVTNKLAGGHRHATHSLLFCGAVGVLCWWSLSYRWAAAIIVAAMMLLVLRMILPLGVGRKGLIPAALVMAAVVWVAHSNDVQAWLPVTAAIGTSLHLVGDMLTKEGVPLFWPLKWRVAVPVLGHTQSWREVLLGSLMSIGIIVACWLNLVVPMEAQAQAQVASHHPTVSVPAPAAPVTSTGVDLFQRVRQFLSHI